MEEGDDRGDAAVDVAESAGLPLAHPPAWSFRDLAAYGMAGRIGSRATGHDVRALGEPLES